MKIVKLKLIQIRQIINNLVFPKGNLGSPLNGKEAGAQLKELGSEHLLQPSCVD